jgi:hypothetical protein
VVLSLGEAIPAGSATPNPVIPGTVVTSLGSSGSLTFSSNLVIPLALESVKKAEKDKRDYLEKLESAEGEDVFKYLLIIDTVAMERYIGQTRIQANDSFVLSKIAAIIGFILIAVGLTISLILKALGNSDLSPGYLSSIAGILTEFISGIFFYLYNRTLEQLNRFHDKMLQSRQTALSLLASNSIDDKGKRDDNKAELAKLMITMYSNKK